MTRANSRVVVLTGPRQLQLELRPVPEPGRGELLLAVDAATTCGTDLKVYRRGGHPRMLAPPSPFGHEVTGTVAATGPGVTGWREGDPVVVANSASCGLCAACRSGRENLCADLEYINGAFADHLLVPARFAERSTVARPGGLAPATAALTEPLACVLHGLEVVGPAVPERVLVVGAGPIGLMFCAVLAARGAEVRVADLARARLEIARTLGAAGAIELGGGEEDADPIRDPGDGATGFDLVVEATGVPEAWSTAMRAAAVGGTVLLFGGCAPGTTVPLDSHWLHYSERRVLGAYHHRPATVRQAIDLLAGGSLSLKRLIQAHGGLREVEAFLEGMERREILKAAILPAES